MEGLEEVCFNIIMNVGSARSDYIEAIQLAKEEKFEEAMEMVASGKKNFSEGHKAHGELIAKDANGELEAAGLLLMHAEDQLMSAEGFGILAEEFIALYQKLYERK